MSIRATKISAHMPPGGMKCIKMGIGYDKKVLMIHSYVNYLLGEMGGPWLIRRNFVAALIWGYAMCVLEIV